MLNITIASLSLSSLYFSSPMFTGNKYRFQQSFLNYIISPILFYNQEQLELTKNRFTHGIGSLLYYDGDDYDSFQNKYVNNGNWTVISTTDIKKLFIISNCFFDQLSIIREDQKFINTPRNVTFYMTSCTFNRCDFATTTIYLQSRANTISHICC